MDDSAKKPQMPSGMNEYGYRERVQSTENGSGDVVPIVSQNIRFDAIEVAINKHEEWLTRLDTHKRVFRLEERLKAAEARMDVLEAPNPKEPPESVTMPDLAAIRCDIQALKAALGALGKHVHLPNGGLGLPLNLNLK